jgi:K+-transporting ATPase A subunit
MNLYSWLQLIVYFVILLALAKPLGSFMAKVYQGEHTFLEPVLGPVERFMLALRGVPYRPIGAAQLLRDNLLIYGLGGLVAPFIGLKLIDMLLVVLHLT